MRIKKLTLRNFCQHRDRELLFEPGLNMLVGPNGSGKTNVLRALQFALIGDAGGDRTKADDIYQGTSEDAESFVEAEVHHAGSDMVIHRGLQPASNWLRIGEQEWRTVGDINTELWKRLGATKKQIADYIFVRQRGVDAMFDQRPAERAASLAALFGVEHAERVHKKLGEFIASVEVPTTSIDEDDLKSQLQELEQSREQYRQALQDLQLPEQPQRVLEAHRDTIARYHARQELQQRLDNTEHARQSKLAELNTLKEPLQEIKVAIAELNEGIAAIAPDCDAAAADLSRWEQHKAATQARESLARAREQFAERWADLKPPAKPDVPDLLPQGYQQLQNCKQRLNELHASLAGLQGADVCPTCGQKMPGAAEQQNRRDQLQQELDQLNKMWIEPLTERHDVWEEYRAAEAEYQKNVQTRDQEAARIEEQAQALQLFDPPTRPEEELRAIIGEREAFHTAVEELKTSMHEHEVRRSTLAGEHTQLQQLQQELQRELEGTEEVSQTAYKQAERAKAELSAGIEHAEQINRELAVVSAEHDSTQRQLQDVQRTKKAGEQIRLAVQHLTKVREIFHRNEAPRMVSYTYVESMLDEVNKTLDLFDAPYRVAMDENLSFTARFLDGVRVQPDKRLSVGERIVLAMAFRITVNATFAGQVGVLVLDEPTAGLDEHNLGSLPHALDKLRDLSQERGLQVVFVTHEPRISHYFDNTIQLTAA